MSKSFLIPTLIISSLIVITALPTGSSLSANAQTIKDGRRPFFMALDTLTGLDIRAVSNRGGDQATVHSDIATYRGRRAVHLVNDDRGIVKGNRAGGESLAI